MPPITPGAYGATDTLVDYILGITYEIWEAGRIELIDQYYADDATVYGLEALHRGAATMIDGTRAALTAFPDRLLLGDDVIGTGDGHAGYSSHRVLSPATNSGATVFGPATGRQVRFMNMADCVVEEGVIVEEWLARDNLALVRQLGFDARDAASIVAGRQSDDLLGWFESEHERLQGVGSVRSSSTFAGIDPQALLHAQWISGDTDYLTSTYQPYGVLHRSPVEIVSGQPAIDGHYRHLRSAFDMRAAVADHVCLQSRSDGTDHIAIRWAASGQHTGAYIGIAPTGKAVYVMGISHLRLVNQRIAVEWTVFDSLGVMAQLID